MAILLLPYWAILGSIYVNMAIWQVFPPPLLLDFIAYYIASQCILSLVMILVLMLRIHTTDSQLVP